MVVRDAESRLRPRGLNTFLVMVPINPVTSTGLVVKVRVQNQDNRLSRRSRLRFDLSSELIDAVDRCVTAPTCPMSSTELSEASSLISQAPEVGFSDSANLCFTSINSGGLMQQMIFQTLQSSEPLVKRVDFVNLTPDVKFAYTTNEISESQARACAALVGCPLFAAGESDDP